MVISLRGGSTSTSAPSSTITVSGSGSTHPAVNNCGFGIACTTIDRSTRGGS
ncbi:hypothetical protein C6A87_002260 [Mycobacterium sp. ITM-2016-00317]|nr:hypothetical protein [Mycobacterium sp. ITM-2016-00317]WNG90561.1 hypothetical protein C6A87_002260 [Mycobacterium sp. ITM-2016-00317]